MLGRREPVFRRRLCPELCRRVRIIFIRAVFNHEIFDRNFTFSVTQWMFDSDLVDQQRSDDMNVRV